MHLQGWTNPPPEWIEAAVKDGKLVVFYDHKTKAQLLKGTAINPTTGITIVFE